MSTHACSLYITNTPECQVANTQVGLLFCLHLSCTLSLKVPCPCPASWRVGKGV